MKKAIVSLATAKYTKGRVRLYDSLAGKFDGDVFIYNSEAEVSAPAHHDNPYAFKLYAIDQLRIAGFRQILWLDASCHAVKNVQPIFDWLTEKGIFLEEAGHMAGSWTNDFALEYFGITREQAMQMPMFSAGFTGLDFDNEISRKFFDKWYLSMLAGCFKGSWDNHRHDMACGSIIANQMGLFDKFSKGGTYFAYIGEVYGQPKDSVIFHVESGT